MNPGGEKLVDSVPEADKSVGDQLAEMPKGATQQGLAVAAPEKAQDTAVNAEEKEMLQRWFAMKAIVETQAKVAAAQAQLLNSLSGTSALFSPEEVMKLLASQPNTASRVSFLPALSNFLVPTERSKPPTKEPKLYRKRKWTKSGKFSSKYRGVTFQKRDSKYIARAWINGKIVHLGTFDKEKEAAKRVREKYREVYGDSADENDDLDIQN